MKKHFNRLVVGGLFVIGIILFLFVYDAWKESDDPASIVAGYLIISYAVGCYFIKNENNIDSKR